MFFDATGQLVGGTLGHSDTLEAAEAVLFCLFCSCHGGKHILAKAKQKAAKLIDLIPPLQTIQLQQAPFTHAILFRPVRARSRIDNFSLFRATLLQHVPAKH